MIGHLNRGLPAVACALFAVGAATAQARIVQGPDVIDAPASVANSSALGGASNDHQQGFDERQRVTLTDDLAVDDGGVVPAGATVDSHMVFLNVPDGGPTTTDFGAAWRFSGPVLGVMSDRDGALETGSSWLLGAAGTSYPASPFANRGLELAPGDPARGAGGETSEGYTIDGGTLTVGLTASQPGDWIRVITQSPVVACSGATAAPVSLWPPNHTLRTVTVGGVTDARITGVTQDEPVDGTGDGDTGPDAAAGPDPGTVQLRAERSGEGDGRVYTIAFTGLAEGGAPCTGTVAVSVPHSRSAPAVDSGSSYDAFGG